MALLRRNGKPLTFHLIDLTDNERATMTELIRAHGGELTDEEDTLVKFTSEHTFRQTTYTWAKIYDVKFIVQCIKESRFVEPENFRLGKKMPEDEFCMLHFLYGDCNHERKQIAPKEHLSGSTVIVSDSDDLLALLKLTQNSDVYMSAQSANNEVPGSQIMDIDETLFNAGIKIEPACTVVPRTIDESQRIILGAEIPDYSPLFAACDVSMENFHENQAKRSCNDDKYDLGTKSKSSMIENEARRIKIMENHRQPVKSRTCTSEDPTTNGLPLIPIDSGITKNRSNTSKRMDDDASRLREFEIVEIKEEPSDYSENMKNSDASSYLKIIPEARQRIIEPIERACNTKNLTNIDEETLSSESMPENMRKSWNSVRKKRNADGEKKSNDREDNEDGDKKRGSEEHENSTDDDIVRRTISVNHENLLNNLRCVLRTDKSSDFTRRLANIRRCSRENETILPINSSEREEKYDEGSSVAMEKSRIPEAECTVDETRQTDSMKLPSNREKLKKMKNSSKLLPILYDNPGENVNSDDSGDSRLARKDSLRKKRKRETRSTLARDRNFIADPKNSSERRNDDDNEAGPSRIDDSLCCGDDDDQRTTRYGVRHMIVDQAGRCSDAGYYDVDDEEKVENIVVLPKIEHYLPIETSRGRLWRSRLIEPQVKNDKAGKFRKPFTPLERRKMLHYLIEKDRVGMAKGLIVWKEMIEDGHLTHRTPQSLQNHFQKHILPNIMSADWLKESERQLFLALRANNATK